MDEPLYHLQLQAGDPLHLLSWTMQNGFAQVSVSPTYRDHPVLWIRPKYLRIPGPRPGLLWVEFTTSDWEGRSWTFHPKNFVAWVSRSDGLAQLDPRERAQLEHYLAVSRQRLSREGVCELFGFNVNSYTYVAVGLGKAEGEGMYSRRLHVTIAYLPIVSTEAEYKLRQRLQQIINVWRDTPPPERAKAIIRSRALYVGDCQDDIDGLLSVAPDQMDQALQAGTLRLVHCHIDPTEEPERYAEEARRLQRRDWLRLNTAHDRSKTLPQLTANGITANPSSGLRDSLELRDLCAYLQDAVRHWPGVLPSSAERPVRIWPRILHETNWHISRGQDFRQQIVETWSF